MFYPYNLLFTSTFLLFPPTSLLSIWAAFVVVATIQVQWVQQKHVYEHEGDV